MEMETAFKWCMRSEESKVRAPDVDRWALDLLYKVFQIFTFH